jgi:hypothetical protein
MRQVIHPVFGRTILELWASALMCWLQGPEIQFWRRIQALPGSKDYAFHVELVYCRLANIRRRLPSASKTKRFVIGHIAHPGQEVRAFVR